MLCVPCPMMVSVVCPHHGSHAGVHGKTRNKGHLYAFDCTVHGVKEHRRMSSRRRSDRSRSRDSSDDEGTKRRRPTGGEPSAVMPMPQGPSPVVLGPFPAAALNPMANPALAAILNKLSAAPQPPPPPPPIMHAPSSSSSSAVNPAFLAHPAIFLAPSPAGLKEAKELFVGNVTATGISDVVLKDFLNAAMRQVGLLTGPEDAISGVRMNSKFCFIEMRTVEDCSNALNLNGIPFMGSMLKIGRPAKYSGPQTPCKTWQEITGQTVPVIANLGIAATAAVASDPATKVFREIFVGNTTPEMTETSIREFIGGALQRMGLSCFDSENPIASVRVNAKFCFLEFRTLEDAANVLNLNGIPFGGVPLKISRPAKFETLCTGSFHSWDDLLARWMTGELKLLTGGPLSRTLCITNMVSREDLSNQDLFDEMIEDTKEECSNFGKVQAVTVPRPGQDGAPPTRGLGRLFVEMSTEEEAKAVLVALKGRTFDSRTVDVKFYPQDAFVTGDYGITFPPMVVTQAGLVTIAALFPTRAP